MPSDPDTNETNENSPDGIIARPGQSLTEHADGVYDNATELIPDGTTTVYGDDFGRVMKAVAYLHDISKGTTWWQRYIRDLDPGAPTERYTDHSLPSAYVTLHALNTLGVSRECQLAAWWAVTKHHSVIPNIGERTTEYTQTSRPNTEQMYNRIADQLTKVGATAPVTAETLLGKATDGALSWDEIATTAPARYTLGIELPDGGVDPRFYHTVLRIWTTLTCADKLDAAGITLSKQQDRQRALGDVLDPGAIQTHIDDDLDEADNPVVRELNTLRTEARTNTRTALMDHVDGGSDQNIFTLTLPTGFGKTFAALEAALACCVEGDASRVIYALPFTTIIDQTDETIRDVFGVDSGDPAYTIHHSLQETYTRLEDDGGNHENGNEDPASRNELLYGETLLSHLNLTTFVQLFESIAGPGNIQGIKLPALQDSVIIIDEPQALTLDWWHLVSRLIEILDDEYNATVILMTATQPRIIDVCSPTIDPEPLLPDRSPYEDFLAEHERVRFTVDPSLRAYLGDETTAETTVNPSAAASRLVDELLAEGGDSLLSVGNTVRSVRDMSLKVTRQIRDRGYDPIDICAHLIDFHRSPMARHADRNETGDDDETAREYLAYLDQIGADPDVITASLTTRLRPVDRSLLIATLGRLLDSDSDTPFDDRPLLVTSTQLIEAGVDISFETLYRDFAPLSSIVQSAGRCNRSYDGQGRGEVHIWRLDGESGPPSDLIYARDRDLLRPTRHAVTEILSRETVSRSGPATAIPEHVMISDAVDEYYDSIHAAQNRTQHTDTMTRWVDQARGEDLRNASLIDTGYPTVDVIVVVTDAEQAALNHYRQVRSRDTATHHDRQRAFDALKPLIVSLPVSSTSLSINGDDGEATDELYAIERGSGAYNPANGGGVRGDSIMTDTQI